MKPARGITRSVLACGSPLPLWLRSAAGKAWGRPPAHSLARSSKAPHSKTWRQRLVGFCLLLSVSCLPALAQPFAIDWFTVDGGGGTSTGSVYSVSGTAGQPDAGGPLTGGNFALTGGFWSLLSVVQTPGAPLLTITLTATNTAGVSWPSPATGFNLQQNTNLNTANWTATTNEVTDNGATRFIIVNPPSGNRFYRLFKP